jgi:hypothetical protein
MIAFIIIIIIFEKCNLSIYWDQLSHSIYPDFVNIVKTRLRNQMRDEWMNDNLVIYIENDMFKEVSNETII